MTDQSVTANTMDREDVKAARQRAVERARDAYMVQKSCMLTAPNKEEQKAINRLVFDMIDVFISGRIGRIAELERFVEENASNMRHFEILEVLNKDYDTINEWMSDKSGRVLDDIVKKLKSFSPSGDTNKYRSFLKKIINEFSPVIASTAETEEKFEEKICEIAMNQHEFEIHKDPNVEGSGEYEETAIELSNRVRELRQKEIEENIDLPFEMSQENAFLWRSYSRLRKDPSQIDSIIKELFENEFPGAVASAVALRDAAEKYRIQILNGELEPDCKP